MAVVAAHMNIGNSPARFLNSHVTSFSIAILSAMFINDSRRARRFQYDGVLLCRRESTLLRTPSFLMRVGS